MICSADIREWRNRDVVDPKQRRFGMLDAVYVDAATDEPAMATVRTGLPTRHRLVFVLLDDAVLGPGYVKIFTPGDRYGRRPRSIRTTCRRPGRRKRSSGTTA